MSRNTRPLVFIISAPSGTGKTTLIHRAMVRDPRLAFSVSHTTRTPREGETHGKDYYFVSRETFRKMIEEDAFIEWANVYGEYYGTSREEISRLHRLGKDVVLDIDVQGATQVMERLARNTWVSIFILPPDLGTLRRRLVTRGKDSPEAIEKRLKAATDEMGYAPKYDYQIVNDDLERATRKLLSIFAREREKSET